MQQRRLLVAGSMAVLAIVVLWLPKPGRSEHISDYATCAAAGYPITDTEPPVCRGPGNQNYTGPHQNMAPDGPAYTSRNFQILVDGDLATGYQRGQQVITTQADWQAFWSKLHEGTNTSPPVIPVDFEVHDVVAFVQGRQSTDGYSLRVTAVLTSDSGSSLSFVEQSPGPLCPVVAKSSNRYLLIQTPKLPEPVSFKISDVAHDCR